MNPNESPLLRAYDKLGKANAASELIHISVSTLEAMIPLFGVLAQDKSLSIETADEIKEYESKFRTAVSALKDSGNFAKSLLARASESLTKQYEPPLNRFTVTELIEELNRRKSRITE